VIDFGSSCFEAQPVYTYIQSRFYRSPEVILGLPYFCAIDMWSFGCILAELYCGQPLFAGENEVEQLACIMEVLGVPPASLVSECSRRKQFFDAEGHPRIVANSKGKKRRPASKDLLSTLRCTDMSFVSFLEGCLQWDAAERFTPDSALRHEWLAELVSQPAAAAAGGGRSASGMDRPGTGGNRSARGGARSVAAAVSRPAVPTFAVGYAGERDAESARASARETAALSGGLAPLPSIGDVGVGSLGAVAGGPVRRAGRR